MLDGDKDKKGNRLLLNNRMELFLILLKLKLAKKSRIALGVRQSNYFYPFLFPKIKIIK